MVSDREGMPNHVLEYMVTLTRSLHMLLSDEVAARQMGERGSALLDSGRFTVQEEHRGPTDLLEEVGGETKASPDVRPWGAPTVPDGGPHPAKVAPRHRIALVESGSGLGGSSKCVHDWLECFDLSRHEFYVFARAQVGWYSDLGEGRRARGLVFTGMGLPPLTKGSWQTRYRTRLLDLLRMAPAVWFYWRQFRRLGIDLVHINNNLFGQLPAILAARLASLPVLCHLHDQAPLTWIERRAVPLVDHFFVLGREGREFYRQWIPAEKLEIVSNGLLLSEQRPRAQMGEERSNPHPPCVGVVGRLIEWKGQETLVRALPRVRARIPAVHLYVIGDDPSGATAYRELLQELVTELGCADAVTFTGWLTDPRSMMSQMDVLVCPSLAPEPFGLVLLEAMSLGVPVIASRHGGPLDIIDEGRDGLFFRPGDAADLAEKVLSLLEDRALAQRLAVAAEATVRSRYALERIVPRIQEAYDRLLQGRPPWRPTD